MPMTPGVPSASASPASSGKPPKYGSHSQVSGSRSLSSAGIKLSSFITYSSRLADGGGRHDGLDRWPAEERPSRERSQRHLSARFSPWLSPAQARNSVEGA